MIDLLPRLLLLLTCMLLSAIFSGMETAVISANGIRLHHLIKNNIRGAAEMDYLLHNPEHFLGTVLLGNNLCNVICSVTAASIAVDLLGQAGSWISGILMTIVLLIFCEYLPKAWFQSKPSMRGRHFAPLLHRLSRIFYPAVQLISFICRHLFPVSTRNTDTRHSITRDELRHLTMETERTGALSERERQMIRSVFDLERKTCRDIMTPRAEMILVAASMPREKLMDLARRKKHNRYPVFQDSTGHIIGIVNILDAATDPLPAGKTAADYMRAPQRMPASMPPDDVLTRMRHTHQPFAMVADAQDQIIGLVTLEDVLEEIIGQIA